MYLMNIINIIRMAFRIYQWILILYALLSWLPGAQDSGLGRFINQLARPYLDIFDRLIPPLGPISFNVIIALFVLGLIERGLLTFIFSVLIR